jgi:hypothetical protein
MISYNSQLKNDLRWEERFNELLKYRDLYGTVNVPNRFVFPEYPYWERRLGSWVCTQRQYHKKGKMAEWRESKLNSVNFDWEPFDTRFEQHFADFLKFKEKYGHVLVPQDCNEYPSLGSWVSHLRVKPVTDEVRKRLNNVGFVWNSIDEYWQIMFRELVEFKRIHGNFKVSERRKGYEKLGPWAVRMRKAKRWGKGQNITNEQIQLLDSIGFDWEPVEADWNRNINKFKEFIAKYNHTLVPIRRCEIEGLGWWVSWVRKNKHKLTNAQIDQLDSLNFEWDAEFAYRARNNIKNIKGLSPDEYTSKISPAWQERVDKVWNNMFDELLKFRDLHGTLNVPGRIKIPGTDKYDGKLYSWVDTQRQFLKQGKLLKWRFEKLESIGFDFYPQETFFNNQIADLIKFKEIYGHTLVPKNCTEFPNLGPWVEHLRKKIISESWKKRLDEIGFVW